MVSVPNPVVATARIATSGGGPRSRRGTMGGDVPPRHPAVRVFALGAAILVQLGIVFFVLHTVLPTPPVAQDVHVVVLPVPEAKIEQPVIKPPEPSLRQPAPVLPALPVIQVEQPPLPRTASPLPAAITVPIEAPPPPPPPPARLPGIEDKFKAAVRDAVYAAHHIPDLARTMNMYGDSEVHFTLRDGVVSDIELVGSSGHHPLDEAALAAVRAAQYPPIPPELQGRRLSFIIVLFRHH
jgi:protein TonB